MKEDRKFLFANSLHGKIIPTIQRFDRKIHDDILENPELFEKMNFQLEAQDYDVNLVRENISDHIQRSC